MCHCISSRVSDRWSVPSHLVRKRMIVLLTCGPLSGFQLLAHGGNCLSLLLNLVHLLSTDSILPLSSQRRFSFSYNPWLLLLFPPLRSGSWSFCSSGSDQYAILHTSSIFDSLVVLCFEQVLSGHTAYSTAPPGAKLSDVQFGRHVDLCQSSHQIINLWRFEDRCNIP